MKILVYDGFSNSEEKTQFTADPDAWDLTAYRSFINARPIGPDTIPFARLLSSIESGTITEFDYVSTDGSGEATRVTRVCYRVSNEPNGAIRTDPTIWPAYDLYGAAQQLALNTNRMIRFIERDGSLSFGSLEQVKRVFDLARALRELRG